MKQEKVASAEVAKWQEILSDSLAEGAKKSPVYMSIASEYGVSYTTVRYHLDPGYRERSNAAARRRYKKLSRRKILRRRYNRNYQRLNRHPERFIGSVFKETDRASTDEISTMLLEFTEGVRFRPATIGKLLDKYIKVARAPPYIQEIDNDVYGRISALQPS